jgi:C-terminal processing protease CtpA/Prc
MESAMKFLGNTDAMIVDLRDHRGGYSETCDRFASYFFDAKKPVKFSDLFDRSTGKTIEVWSDKNTGGIRYTKPLYVLVNKMTASAGEAPAYVLQAYKRSITIGEPTYGIANMGNFFRVNDHFNSFIPYAQGRNPVTGTNWEKTGVVPEVKVSSATALQKAHTLAIEKLIDTASDEDKKMLSMALDRVKA